MATNSQIPFNPQGYTVVISANVAAPAGIQVSVDNRFSAQASGQVRIINSGTVTVHLGVGATAVAAQLNAVEATAGNPAAGIPLVAGAVEIMRFPPDSYFSGLASAAATVYIVPGEGL